MPAFSLPDRSDLPLGRLLRCALRISFESHRANSAQACHAVAPRVSLLHILEELQVHFVHLLITGVAARDCKDVFGHKKTARRRSASPAGLEPATHSLEGCCSIR